MVLWQRSRSGLGLMFQLNADWILFVCAILISLLSGSFVASL